MTTALTRVVREAFRNEWIPARIRWWFAAQGLVEWYEALRAGLAPELGGDRAARERLAAIAATLFQRRYELLRASEPGLPETTREPHAIGWLMGGLYRVASQPSAAWIFDGAGGAPRTLREHVRAERWMAAMDHDARWRELTTHLGEFLVALTERLPAEGVTRARPILGQICFRAGVHAAKKIKHAFALGDGPEDALELLRMSEYVFRVNPQHWSAHDASTKTAYLEGTACPWYTAPGWNGAHCGIFGQFQSGLSSVFGLRYQLTSTIPRHGGHTCRIDLRPIDPRATGAAT